jgi:DNA repair protein radc
MSEKLNINQWAEDDRPREKMMRHGAAALSNAELLAILIGSGNTEENAVELMKRVMKACDDSLVRLGRMSMEELVEYPGIGPAKAISILAACELGNRRVMDRTEQPVIKSAQQVYEYYYPILCDEAAEYSYALLLNQASRVIKNSLIGKGGLSETLVDVRIVLREALINKASSFILCHNHPGGSLRPSRQDDQLTQKVREAASLMNIRLVDHVIFTTSGYYSYADEGRI